MNPWARAATETFEEVMGTSESESTFFRESNEGFFDIVDRLSAEQAPQKLAVKSSIVAHTRHALAYIEGDLVAINGG